MAVLLLWCESSAMEIDNDVLAHYKAEGCTALKKGTLRELDALVGETACQWRALEIADLYDQVLSGKGLTEQQEKYIGYCRALTAIKVYDLSDSQSIKESLNQKLLNLPKRKAKALVDTAQRAVAAESVRYAQDEVTALLPESCRKIVQKALSVEQLTELERKTIACYPGFIALMNYVKLKKRPIVIRYDTKLSLYLSHIAAFAYGSGGYTQIPLSMLESSQAVFAIDALSNASSLSDIEKNDLEGVIMMQAAMHPLFAGKINAMKELPYEELGISALQTERAELIEKAKKLGVSRNNPKPFYIDHIYAATVGELTQSLSKSQSTNTKEEQS